MPSLNLPSGWAGRPSSFSDFKNRGCLDKILKFVAADNRHIDPVPARQKQQLIQLADKL
jgi:hypothetical protein